MTTSTGLLILIHGVVSLSYATSKITEFHSVYHMTINVLLIAKEQNKKKIN